jgi:hypothetical protein
LPASRQQRQKTGCKQYNLLQNTFHGCTSVQEKGGNMSMKKFKNGPIKPGNDCGTMPAPPKPKPGKPTK